MKKRVVSIALILVLCSSALFLLAGCSSEEKVVRVEYAPGAVFTTNVKNSYSIFKTAVVLVLDKEGLEDMLDQNLTSIRDTIIFILRDLDEEAIQKPGRHDDLRERIMNDLNELLGIENIVEVRFNDFVMGR